MASKFFVSLVRWTVARIPNTLRERLLSLGRSTPTISPALEWVAKKFKSDVGVISSGVGAGLLIHAEHGFASYLIGDAEMEEQEWLLEHLKPGDVVYEIGANVGFFAIICAKLVGETGSVQAFEPQPYCAESCRKNFEMNGFTSSSVHEVVLSDHEGKVAFEFSKSQTALGKVLTDDKSATDRQVAEIPCMPLDSAVDSQRLPPPSLLKIDVEGHELNVLTGGMQVIASHRPTILCEVHWLGDKFLDFVNHHLIPLGYTLSNLSDSPIPAAPERWHAVLSPRRCN